MSPTVVLVLLALVATCSCKPAVGVEPNKFYPCDVEERDDGGMVVECPYGTPADAVKQAFVTNYPNEGIVSLHMHSDIDGSILDFLAQYDVLSASYSSMTELVVSYSLAKTVPKIISKLPALQHVYLDHGAVESIQVGDLNFQSPQNMKLMTVSYAPLYRVEAGAFPEGFSADVHFKQDELHQLTEGAFKPLLQTGAKLSYDSPVINCDCGLSWLCRDGRDMLAQVSGKCVTPSGKVIPLQDTSAQDFSNCP